MFWFVVVVVVCCEKTLWFFCFIQSVCWPPPARGDRAQPAAVAAAAHAIVFVYYNLTKKYGLQKIPRGRKYSHWLMLY